MDSYNGYLIFSDIDGTLAQGGEISKENLHAIQKFQEKGGLFALSTGRKPDYIARFPFRSNAPVITINGTLLCSPTGETLLALPMDEDFADVLCDIIKNYPEMQRAYRHELSVTREWSAERTPNDPSELLGGSPCFKFVFVLTTEEAALRMMHTLTQRYGDRYEFDRSWPVGVEMHRKGSGKGVCIRHVRTLLPEVHTVIAAGDFENDITMLREADIGCAVENAIPAVKEAADRVIVPCAAHAIAYIIDTLIPQLEREKCSIG